VLNRGRRTAFISLIPPKIKTRGADSSANEKKFLESTLMPYAGKVLNLKLESPPGASFNGYRTRAASYGRPTVGALCPFNSMTSAAAMH
jgi:hypothetical protein